MNLSPTSYSKVPRYTADGQVCKIGMEKRQYSPELIRVSRLSHAGEKPKSSGSTYKQRASKIALA